MFIFIILPLSTLSRGSHKSRAGWKLWLSQGKRNRDTGLILPRVLFFLLLWTRKSPAFKRKILKAGLLFTRYSVLFLMDSKNRKANFHYSSSILESYFLVVTGTVSQFGEVYFPLRPLCVFDYNENCCQNDVTPSSRPLRIEIFDFFKSSAHSCRSHLHNS